MICIDDKGIYKKVVFATIGFHQIADKDSTIVSLNKGKTLADAFLDDLDTSSRLVREKDDTTTKNA